MRPLNTLTKIIARGCSPARFQLWLRDERFYIQKHKILIKEITLNELFIEELSATPAKLHFKVPVRILPEAIKLNPIREFSAILSIGIMKS